MYGFITEPERKTPVLKRVDVVVAGGGPAGFGAAMGAARNGANTLLIERYGFLGGGFTAQGVTELPLWLLTPMESYGDERSSIGGVIQELIDRLIELDGFFRPSDWIKYKPGGESYWIELDAEAMKFLMHDMLESAGVELLLHSMVVGTMMEDDAVKGVLVENKSGRQAILADMVVDATGDGDAAIATGASYEKARGRLLALTLQSKIASVDIEKAKASRVSIDELFAEAVKKGELPQPGPSMIQDVKGELGMVGAWPLEPGPLKWRRRGEVNVWGPHHGGDCSDVSDLTEAEISTRNMVLDYVNFLRKRVPGFENAFLSWTPAQIGVRESRRILGGYFLTADGDIREERKHDDVVVRTRRGSVGEKGLPWLSKEDVGPTFDIPYRCLVPLRIDGLLVAGRCISIDHKAATYFAPRDEATCMALGEAAGTAAALSSKDKVKPRDLDVSALQKRLRKQGII